jgi:hypothetical protein
MKHINGLELCIIDDLLDNKDFIDFDVLFVNPIQVKFIMSAETFKLKNKILDF